MKNRMISCSWIRRINIVKMAALQGNVHVQWNPLKMPMILLIEVEKSTLKFM
jgi:hypothetical protein